MSEILQPPGWPRPKGYANGVSARGRLVFTAGQVGWDTHGNFPGVLAGQVELALANVVAVLSEAGAGPEHLVRLTWFITDRQAYLDAQSEIGAAYRRVLGRHYPAMSLVEVSALVESKALVEIEATAVIPD
ncbi:MAG: RidA family protein [Gammaproteobacteria bacterium]|nr:RidA family protein [Gammaproteobacteria bacterium]MXW46220.1 RidA family protein [Gammaproteobacteria bacterium]MYD00863.1 RidA family protein [Gammaproteobacteria bacterium]MYI24958.1 RidA family protein [Gammaproteobacteria bacterium]